MGLQLLQGFSMHTTLIVSQMFFDTALLVMGTIRLAVSDRRMVRQAHCNALSRVSVLRMWFTGGATAPIIHLKCESRTKMLCNTALSKMRNKWFLARHLSLQTPHCAIEQTVANRRRAHFWHSIKNSGMGQSLAQ